VFSDDARTIKALSDQLIALKLSLQSGVELHTAFVSSKMLERIATLGPSLLLCKVFDMLMQETLSANVEYLERLNPTPMDPSLRLGCLNGTRQDTLEFVSNWLMAPSDDQNILWLHGVPGCGKSTISTTIAQYFRDLGRLGAFLFFDRNNVSDEPNTVIRTLSYQLASFDPVINAAVCAQIERNPTIVDVRPSSMHPCMISSFSCFRSHFIHILD